MRIENKLALVYMISRIKDKMASLIIENEKIKKNAEKDKAKIEEELEDLKYDCDEMKEMLGYIQCRYLSKNFLHCFKSYLTKSDKINIDEGKISKGEAISKRIEFIYKNVNKKKLSIVQNLLKASSKLLDDGNYFAHTLILKNFAEDIKAYKEEKKLDEVNLPEVFCFLTNLELSKNSFDDTFSFLAKFFTKNLRPKEEINILEEYFK